MYRDGNQFDAPPATATRMPADNVDPCVGELDALGVCGGHEGCAGDVDVSAVVIALATNDNAWTMVVQMR